MVSLAWQTPYFCSQFCNLSELTSVKKVQAMAALPSHWSVGLYWTVLAQPPQPRLCERTQQASVCSTHCARQKVEEKVCFYRTANRRKALGKKDTAPVPKPGRPQKCCALYLQCLFGANLNNFNQQNLYDKLHVTHPYKRETRFGLNLNFEWEVDFQRAPYFSRTDTQTEN